MESDKTQLIDFYCCRILFPIIFASFNLVYWSYYLTTDGGDINDQG